MENKNNNLKSLALAGLASLPLLVAMTLAFQSCDANFQKKLETQRKQEFQEKVLNPYHELVCWAQRENIVSGDYFRIYNSEVTKFLKEKF